MKTHECEQNENNLTISATVYESVGITSWSIECPDRWQEIYDIEYCPFCGVKL